MTNQKSRHQLKVPARDKDAGRQPVAQTTPSVPSLDKTPHSEPAPTQPASVTPKMVNRPVSKKPTTHASTYHTKPSKNGRQINETKKISSSKKVSARRLPPRPAEDTPKSALTNQKTKRVLAHTAHKAERLSAALAQVEETTQIPEKQKTFHIFKKRRLTRIASYVTIFAIILGTAYTGFDIWSTNNHLKSELDTTAAALGSPNPSARQKSEGRDESNVSADMIQDYVVTPSMPRTITIKKAHVNARVLPMDVNPDNSVQAPVNIFDAGWYTGSAKPGEPGAALIDGHASGLTRQGEFAYLDMLQKGDLVEIERGDGQVLTYAVDHIETVALKKLDMMKLLVPYGDAAQGLNLITCTGKYIEHKDGSFTYDHRTIVYTKRTS